MGFLASRWTGDYSLWAGVCHEPLSTIATVASVAATAASTIIGFSGAQAEGKAAQQAANYKAAQQEQQAQESRAASQRSALESRHKAELSQSTLQARAAASGAGATDESVLGLGEQIAARGEYESLLDMYKGENQARGFEDAAKATIINGQAAKQGAQYKAMGTLASGFGSMADKFGKVDWKKYG